LCMFAISDPKKSVIDILNTWELFAFDING
jgi:hypothetical protein